MHPIHEIETVQALAETFFATGDVDYIDNAIGITEEMIAVNPPICVAQPLQTLLSRLLGVKARIAPSECCRQPAQMTNRIVCCPECEILLENMELIKSLSNQFDATGDINYLNNAIGITEQMIEADPPPQILESVRSALSMFLDMKSRSTAPKHVEQATKPIEETVSTTLRVDTGPATATLNGITNYWESMPVREFVELVQSLSHQFDVTGDIDHLDYAIGITEAMIEAGPEHDIAKTLQSFLSRLLERKSESTTPGHVGQFIAPCLITSLRETIKDIERLALHSVMV